MTQGGLLLLTLPCHLGHLWLVRGGAAKGSRANRRKESLGDESWGLGEGREGKVRPVFSHLRQTLATLCFSWGVEGKKTIPLAPRSMWYFQPNKAVNYCCQTRDDIVHVLKIITVVPCGRKKTERGQVGEGWIGKSVHSMYGYRHTRKLTLEKVQIYIGTHKTSKTKT